MAQLKLLIAEDDVVIAQNLSLSLESMGYEVCQVLSSGEELLLQVHQHQPDLIILDITLEGKLDGIETAALLAKATRVPFIFMTAFSDKETVDRAKQTNPHAYLVKPFDARTLQSSIELAIHNAGTRQLQPPQAAIPVQPTDTVEADNFLLHDALFVKVRNRLEKVMLEDIVWAEAQDIYCNIKTRTHLHLVSQSLKNLEQRLPASQFMRVHRSYIVQLTAIEAIEDNNILIGGKQIPIGNTHKDALLKRLQIL
ncbi:LytR/AlgR family response regulator transcription factor [Pontibacter ramchanderi]|uniref:LytTR family two component transcriptional regulator n=1 Tax=Pontibacter ramchanderi TaxID=1179743 RepID=A0A2N3UD76_9BACT|nr:response regulator [Pontibacter ramchanderi]PKV67330.1 LytTR family two component transcriptional regulator [Pontibacter ramchanderi]